MGHPIIQLNSSSWIHVGCSLSWKIWDVSLHWYFLPKQNWSDSRATKIKFNPTKVWDLMAHAVLESLIPIFWDMIEKSCPHIDSEGETDWGREPAGAGVVVAAGRGRGQGHRQPAGRGRRSAEEDGELCGVSERYRVTQPLSREIFYRPSTMLPRAVGLMV